MERQKWTMDELNAWDAEGLTEKQIMDICKEIYPVGSRVESTYRTYIANIEPATWDGHPRKIWVASGCGLCYDIEKPIGERFHKAYYM